MTGVVRLITEEPASVSIETVEALRSGVAPESWSEFLEDIAFGLTRDLACLERAMQERDRAAVEAVAHRLATAAASVGLHELAQVSYALRDVLEQQDPVATAALAARVLRLGGASLIALVAADEPLGDD
ncbi:MAG: Hpt domain-containing protein [Pseudomonadota bacterium]